MKRYFSEKVETEEGWGHLRIELRPENPDHEVIELGAEQSERLQVIAELLEVL